MNSFTQRRKDAKKGALLVCVLLLVAGIAQAADWFVVMPVADLAEPVPEELPHAVEGHSWREACVYDITEDSTYALVKVGCRDVAPLCRQSAPYAEELAVWDSLCGPLLSKAAADSVLSAHRVE